MTPWYDWQSEASASELAAVPLKNKVDLAFGLKEFAKFIRGLRRPGIVSIRRYVTLIGGFSGGAMLRDKSQHSCRLRTAARALWSRRSSSMVLSRSRSEGQAGVPKLQRVLWSERVVSNPSTKARARIKSAEKKGPQTLPKRLVERLDSK